MSPWNLLARRECWTVRGTERRMPINWTMGASLIDVGERFPRPGTIETCIEAWRQLTPEHQKTATLLTELPVQTSETILPKTSFRGHALEELSALLDGSSERA